MGLPALHAARSATEPIVSKIEVLGGKRCRNEFEDRQRHAARIDLFENQANGLFAGGFAQRDDGHVITRKCLDHLLPKFHVEAEVGRRNGVLLGEPEQFHLPLVCVQDLVAGEAKMLALEQSAGEIQFDVLAEVLLQLAVSFDGEERLVDPVGIERFLDVDVVVALDGPTFGVEGLDGRLQRQNLR